MHLKLLETDVAINFARHLRVWGPCVKCDIGRMAHKHVFARGELPCDVLVIGEGPGKTEDVMGWPFVGRSGKLLTEWIEKARSAYFRSLDKDVQLKAVFNETCTIRFAVSNIVLCRPCDRPGGPNRGPSFQEIENCRPRLEEFVKYIAKPKATITLGRYAAIACPKWEMPRLELAHPAWVLRKGGSGCEADDEQVSKLNRFVLEIK